MLIDATSRSCAELALEVGNVTYTETGWAFDWRGLRYEMPDPYPECILPESEHAPRLCAKAMVRGTAVEVAA